MPNYKALNAMVIRHKSALTRAKKKGPEAVIIACDAAFEAFNNGLWPDNWRTWERAKQDAQMELARNAWVRHDHDY